MKQKKIIFIYSRSLSPSFTLSLSYSLFPYYFQYISCPLSKATALSTAPTSPTPAAAPREKAPSRARRKQRLPTCPRRPGPADSCP